MYKTFLRYFKGYFIFCNATKFQEYFTEDNPNCDQYRYLNLFVKKWRWVDKTPEGVQNLVNEVYGIDVSSDDFLKSILREISYSLD